MPGPVSINDFPPLPQSSKSDLPGDTWQVPNIAGYFSNNYRKLVVSYYQDNYKDSLLVKIPPLRLNYAPELAYLTVRQYTDSTYLEELVYPLRDSLYINGFEPIQEDGQPRYWGAGKFSVDGSSYSTKTTIRFYSSPVWVRMLVWSGIVASFFLLYKTSRKVFLSS